MDTRRNRVVLVTLGSRGDVQPFCVLGRELQARGYAVRLVASRDYDHLARRFGLDRADIGAVFEDLLHEPRFHDVVHYRFRPSLRTMLAARELSRRVADMFTQMLLRSLHEIRSADLVIFNPIAFFAGELARELGIPSIRVSSQPLLPSRHALVCTVGTRDLGPVLNRLSYETFRAASLILRRSFRAFRQISGVGQGLHAFMNPLTCCLHGSDQIMAYSPVLSPNPGDWPVEGVVTGFWYDEPRPGETLPAPVSAFLAAGPPPVFISFGSMVWGARRNTELVMQALARWGGRAILATGAGGLKPPAELPANVMALKGISHALLFPHLAGIVHHGGSGTTAAAMRAGLPTITLPFLGDQLYWGGRVAALGAGEAPVPIGRMTADALAAGLTRITRDGRYRAAARDIADALARDPGVPAAIGHIDRIMARPATLH